jgi:hypothetical protein
MSKTWLVLVIAVALAGVAVRQLGGNESQSVRSLTTSPDSSAQSASAPALLPAGGIRLTDQGLPPSDPPAVDIASARPVGEMTLAAVMSSSTPGQKAVVEDGWITLEERNAAITRAQDCTVAGVAHLGGVEVRPLYEAASGELEIAGFSAVTREQLTKASEVHRSCVFEHWADVAAAWTSWAAEERVRTLWAEVEACMREKGADPVEGANWQQLQATSRDFTGDLSLYDECRPDTEAPGY